jgi:hypothetical protein
MSLAQLSPSLFLFFLLPCESKVNSQDSPGVGVWQYCLRPGEKNNVYFKKRSRNSHMLAVSDPRNCTILAISGPEVGTRNHQNRALSGAINCQEMAISGAINCQKVLIYFWRHKLPKWSSFWGHKLPKWSTDPLWALSSHLVSSPVSQHGKLRLCWTSCSVPTDGS